jgi:hypothetical protein
MQTDEPLMKIIWTQVDSSRSDSDIQPFHGKYQDILRSVGAWLDARGFRLTKLSESGGSLVIEVEIGVMGDDLSREVIRLDPESLERLMVAARNDRDRFAAFG